MMAVMAGQRMVLFRRIGAKLVQWRVIQGDTETLARALRTARELHYLALAAGGWTHALRLGLDPVKPVKTTRILSGILFEDELNGSLR